MIVMEISIETFLKYHHPAPDYVFALRRLENYDKLNGIFVPDEIKNQGIKFIPFAELLTVSRYESEDQYIERRKKELLDSKFIGFEFHAVVPVSILPQFRFPDGLNVVALHVKDITIQGDDLEGLIEVQREWEIKEQKRIDEELEAARASFLEAKKEALKTNNKE